MPSFTIHIITAKQYIKNHPNEIKNEKEFINGTIAPDLTNNKSLTHYGVWENLVVITNLDKMLEDPKVDITMDYWKGYFFHLFVDDQFYNNYFKAEWAKVVKNHDRLFNDYYLLNNMLISDYQIVIEENPKEIRKYMMPIDSSEMPKYIDYIKLKNMIKELSEINIDDEVLKFTSD